MQIHMPFHNQWAYYSHVSGAKWKENPSSPEPLPMEWLATSLQVSWVHPEKLSVDQATDLSPFLRALTDAVLGLPVRSVFLLLLLMVPSILKAEVDLLPSNNKYLRPSQPVKNKLWRIQAQPTFNLLYLHINCSMEQRWSNTIMPASSSQ